MFDRKITNEVTIGNVKIGNKNPILIQSMCNTKTNDAEATIRQILELEKEGCEIIRVAVPDEDAASKISEIKRNIHIPLVADIHFDYKLALKSIEGGVDKVRINPGNIGDISKVKEVVDCAKAYKVPIRIGVNSGSLEKELVNRDGKVTAKAMVESALKEVSVLQSLDFNDIVVSIKSSDVETCIEAHELFASQSNIPLHIGITEAGTLLSGCIKSAAGLGILLREGIGDTLRISLTDDPVYEVKAAKALLSSLNIRQFGVQVVSCPTCGRTSIDLIKLANQVTELVKDYKLNIKVAVMGCAVNGPGEAREADLGIAGGKNEGLIFKKGVPVRKVKEEYLLEAFKEELDNL